VKTIEEEGREGGREGGREKRKEYACLMSLHPDIWLVYA